MPRTKGELTFSIGEAAKFFEGKSVPWLRWRESQSKLFVKEDGTPIEIRRSTPRRAKFGYREYTPENIRDIAAALFRAGAITEHEHNRVIQKVEAYEP